jgi:cytochrome c553
MEAAAMGARLCGSGARTGRQAKADEGSEGGPNAATTCQMCHEHQLRPDSRQQRGITNGLTRS